MPRHPLTGEALERRRELNRIMNSNPEFKERAREQMRKIGASWKGKSRPKLPAEETNYRNPLYTVWQNMRRRCLRAGTKQYSDYGGRGITICKEWDDFKRFVADMGPRPDGATLERIDNNGNYEPGNCRWATRLEQAQNTRLTKIIRHGAESHSLKGWSRRLGISYSTVSRHLKKGHDIGYLVEKFGTESTQ